MSFFCLEVKKNSITEVVAQQICRNTVNSSNVISSTLLGKI